MQYLKSWAWRPDGKIRAQPCRLPWLCEQPCDLPFRNCLEAQHSFCTDICLLQSSRCWGDCVPFFLSYVAGLQLRHSHCFVISLAPVRKQISGFQTLGYHPQQEIHFTLGLSTCMYAYICVSKQGVWPNKSPNVTHCFYSSVFCIIELSQVGAGSGISTNISLPSAVRSTFYIVT